MSSQDGAAALNEARRLMTVALAPGSTASARRAFYQQLVTLASYPSYECKAFFGTLVAKFFAEFEDLQDGVIDALLDLCEDEDEKVRIIGIKGLGPTGRADPRWVRGNTGVLLQLLACQPRELAHVRESLLTLMSVSPSEVFAVMADDCKGSQEDTGASRKNILDFLYYDAVEARKDILESGSNIDAEQVFREGFSGVVPTVGGNEGKKILEMLLPISTISGKNADEKTKSAFSRTVTRAIPPGSSAPSTRPIIQIYIDFVERASPKNPRYPLHFLAAHGSALVELVLLERDRSVLKISDKLEYWVEGSIAQWESSQDPADDKDLSSETLIPSFLSAVLPALLKSCDRLHRESRLPSTAIVVEQILYAIFRLVLWREHRRQLILPSDRKALLTLCDDADRAERRTTKNSPESRSLTNIADMAEVLGDPNRSIRKIDPSWKAAGLYRSQPAPVSTSFKTSSNIHNPVASGSSYRPRTSPPSRVSTPPSAPRGPKQDSASQLASVPLRPSSNQTSSSTPSAGSSSARIPTGPTSTSNMPTGPRSSIPLRPAAEPPRSDFAPRTERPPTPPLPPSKQRSDSRSSGVAEPQRAQNNPKQRDHTSIVSAPPTAAAATSSTPSAGLSIRNSALQSAKNERDLSPQPPAQTAPTLAERLGITITPSPSGLSNKRARDGDATSTNGNVSNRRTKDDSKTLKPSAQEGKQPSLLSRLGAREDGPSEPKRAKNDRVVSSGKLSLRDRLNGNSARTSPSPMSIEYADTPTHNQNLETKRGISILNRSVPQSTSETPPAPSSHNAQIPLGLSIKARASPLIATAADPDSPQTSGISIRRLNAPSAPAVLAGDDVVVRKGRGFRASSSPAASVNVPDQQPQSQGQAHGAGSSFGYLARGGGMSAGGRGAGQGRGRGLIRHGRGR